MLRFARDSYDEFIDTGRESGQEEVCGVLAGVSHDRERVGTGGDPTENVATKSITRYAIDLPTSDVPPIVGSRRWRGDDAGFERASVAVQSGVGR